MIKIVLFDQDLQPYREEIYNYFFYELKKYDFQLVIYFDKRINDRIDSEFFHGIEYTFHSFKKTVLLKKPKVIIQFVWLRYKFLLPFMLWAKLLHNQKIIVWSHGINLQNKDQKLKNILYYFRQLLADALIIYTPVQKKYIKASHKKLFTANNTLNFYSFPIIYKDKNALKEEFDVHDRIVLLSVGRFDANNRKVSHLIELSDILNANYQIIIVGQGISKMDKLEIENRKNISYLGVVYDQEIICKLYKMADIFIMPGAIGLALNQAFYFETPVIIEDVEQGPEAYYLTDNKNGFFYKKGDVLDLKQKIEYLIQEDIYPKFCANAKKTIMEKATPEIMLEGFMNAIKYVENGKQNK